MSDTTWCTRLSSYPAGLLADRMPRPAVFGIGLVFFAVGYIGLGLTTDTVAAWVLIGVYGLFTGCTDGVGKAWISSLVGSDLQGSAQGVFQGASGFAVLDRGPVGRLPVGDRRPLAAVDLRSRRCGVRGRAARRRDALPARYDDLDVVKRIGRRADADHRVAALWCALGDRGPRRTARRS